MKREKLKKAVLPDNRAQLNQESTIFIQTDTIKAHCIHANVELGKLKLRRY